MISSRTMRIQFVINEKRYVGCHNQFFGRLCNDQTDNNSYNYKIEQICYLRLYENDQLKHEVNLLQFNPRQAAAFASRIDTACEIEFSFANSGKATKLPNAIAQHLIEFLKRFRPSSESLPTYDCKHFVYELSYGLAATVEGRKNGYYYNSKKGNCREEKLLVGDIVKFTSSKSDQFHYAMHVGEGYYLSLYGQQGPLAMGTSKDIHKDWGTDQITQCKLINPVSRPNLTVNNLPLYAGVFAATCVTIGAVIYGGSLLNHPKTLTIGYK